MILASSVGGFQRVVSVFCTLLTVPIVLRALGPVEFGIWGAAASLAWLAGLVDIGTGFALVTLVARSLARSQTREAASHIASAVTIGACLAVPLLLVAAVVWALGARHIGGAPYLIALVGLALNLPVNPANNAWMGLQEGYFSSTWELVQILLTTAGLLTAALLKAEVWIFVAVVYGCILLANLGSLTHLYLRHPELRPERLPVPWTELKEVASSGALFFFMMISGSLTYLLDNVLALQLLGAEASARMAIAMRLCINAISLLVVISQPLWPAITDAAHRGDRRWILRNLVRSTALLTGAAVAGSALLVLFGERLLRLWLHTGLGIDRVLLWAIAAWIVTQAMFRGPFLLFNGLGMIRFEIVLFSISTAAAFGLKFALAGKMGVAGILWGTSASALLIVLPAGLWRILRWVKHPEEDWKLPLQQGSGKMGDLLPRTEI